jgi:hypothetical protein
LSYLPLSSLRLRDDKIVQFEEWWGDNSYATVNMMLDSFKKGLNEEGPI